MAYAEVLYRSPESQNDSQNTLNIQNKLKYVHLSSIWDRKEIVLLAACNRKF